MLLLRHLPTSYIYFRDALLYKKKQVITLNEVMKNLLLKDRIDSLQIENNGKGLFTRGKFLEKDRSRHSNLVCNYCEGPY
jgi:hypothetical protein